MRRYNQAMYNTEQYNALVVNDYITLTETISIEADVRKSDAVFMADSIAVAVEKGLADTVKVNDWLQIKRDNSDFGGA